ncbi:hypothetical protein [Mesorhizobium sp. M0323]|uniref:hypothetical protein n=1 Tax=unclassified Mesorhizobium TaxID=325217 RepID=UPI00333C1D21
MSIALFQAIRRRPLTQPDGAGRCWLRIGFQGRGIFEIQFLILASRICHFPALAMTPDTGQGRITEK